VSGAGMAGMAMVVDTLCGVLTGANFGADLQLRIRALDQPQDQSVNYYVPTSRTARRASRLLSGNVRVCHPRGCLRGCLGDADQRDGVGWSNQLGVLTCELA